MTQAALTITAQDGTTFSMPTPRVQTVPDASDPVEWAEACVAHNYHQPVPRHLEEHHLIPRAWQAVWHPDGETRVVWRPDTVLLCRSGHGNVHYWIERFMRHYSTAIADAVTAALVDQDNVGRAEHVIARRALEGWEAAGGSLAFLIDQGQYGGIYNQSHAPE